jgi:hypothetical protein
MAGAKIILSTLRRNRMTENPIHELCREMFPNRACTQQCQECPFGDACRNVYQAGIKKALESIADELIHLSNQTYVSKKKYESLKSKLL